MPTVKVDDISIYYEIHGDGEPLVLINGLGSNSNSWFCQIPSFSKEYRVIAFDNRGTGRSDKPDIPYTMQMMAKDMKGFLESINIEAVHLFGISMGGMIAQEFALLYSESVISLVLASTSCGGSSNVMPEPEVLMLLTDTERTKRLTPEEDSRELLSFMCSQQFIDSNQDISEQWIKGRVEYLTPPHGNRRQMEAVMGHDTCDRLPSIEAPTLVIGGDSDKIVPAENLRILASMIPRAELVILENVGHGFLIEAEEEANKAVVDFLKRHPRSG